VLTDSGADAADRAVQVFGGAGFLEETSVAMHYRDARVGRIGGRTDEIQLEILAKRMSL
jgi:acyl-CoA dehydrogenase